MSGPFIERTIKPRGNQISSKPIKTSTVLPTVLLSGGTTAFPVCCETIRLLIAVLVGEKPLERVRNCYGFMAIISEWVLTSFIDVLRAFYMIYLTQNMLFHFFLFSFKYISYGDGVF